MSSSRNAVTTPHQPPFQQRKASREGFNRHQPGRAADTATLAVSGTIHTLSERCALTPSR